MGSIRTFASGINVNVHFLTFEMNVAGVLHFFVADGDYDYVPFSWALGFVINGKPESVFFQGPALDFQDIAVECPARVSGALQYGGSRPCGCDGICKHNRKQKTDRMTRET